MRISGGDARGVVLKVPKGIRPASERVRQAVFSSIAGRIPDARVLDLYAGSGAYGLEAVSRGASSAVMVERDRGSAAVCRANAGSAGLSDHVQVRTADVVGYLRAAAHKDGPFDVVFIDPPYDRAVSDVLELVGPVLVPAALVVLECRFREQAAPSGRGLVVEADRRYGDTRILMYTPGDAGTDVDTQV